MKILINKFKLEDAIERIGLSSAFPYDFIYEMIWYTLDNTILLPLGVKGDICKEVRALYYSGYNDLTAEDGVVQILKDIETSINQNYIQQGELKNKQSSNIQSNIIDKEAYLQALALSTSILTKYKKQEKARVKSITDLSLLQLADPMFKLKFARGEFNHKITEELNISKVVYIEDNTSSMLYPTKFEKMIGFSKGMQETFKDVSITKYSCYKHSIKEVDLNTTPESNTQGKFKLDYYLSRVTDADLIVVCTDAYKTEFKLTSLPIPTIIFNIGEEEYEITQNLTVIKL